MSNNITKAELIASAADIAGVSKAVAEKTINAMLSTIEEGLVDGKKTTLVGFGTFEVGQRPARQGRNPQTGQTIEIPAATVPKFRPGKGLKDAVNK